MTIMQVVAWGLVLSAGLLSFVGAYALLWRSRAADGLALAWIVTGSLATVAVLVAY